MKNLSCLRGNNRHQRSWMPAAFLALFIFGVAVSVGCNKETPVTIDTPSQSENFSADSAQTSDAQSLMFMYQGKLYEREEFQRIFQDKKFPITIVGDGLPEAEVVYVFDSEVDFKTWAKTTQFAGKFAQMENKISEARQRTKLNSSREISSERELDKGAFVLGGNATLYDLSGCRGTSITIQAGKRISSMVILNNKVSSVKITACSGTTVCELYDGVNYSGSRLIVTCSGPACPFSCNCTNLPFGFDNKASSVIVY